MSGGWHGLRHTEASDATGDPGSAHRRAVPSAPSDATGGRATALPPLRGKGTDDSSLLFLMNTKTPWTPPEDAAHVSQAEITAHSRFQNNIW